MILRKPFAILIKNFKKIHFLLTICAFYLVYRTSVILSFYNEYISSYTSVIGTDLTGNLFNGLMYISIFILLVGSLIILGLMLFKHKPVKLYIFNIVTYIAVAVIYAVTYSVTSSLEIGLVDIRTLKVIDDLLTTLFAVQTLSLIILAIRATGFDIKKFNFVKDLEELEINDVDNEEFEVNVDLDSDKWKRKLNRIARHTKYVYKENKLLLTILFVLVIGISSTIIYVNVGIYNKTYTKNETFNSSVFTLRLSDSYSTNEDVEGNELFKEESLVAVLVDVKNNSSKDKTLDSARFVLKVKDHYFYHLPEYREKVSDLGIAYNNQVISSNFTKYMFIYKIPTGFLNEKMTLQYTDYSDKIIKIEVKPINLDEKKEDVILNLKDTIDFKDSILSGVKLTLNNFYIDRTMKVTYDYCISEECYPSSEYLIPTYTGISRKALLFIEGTLEWNDKLPISKMNEINELITKFGKVHYTINGMEYTSDIPLKVVKPNKMTLKNMCYLEVPEEALSATNIKLVFHVRNRTYIYNVK